MTLYRQIMTLLVLFMLIIVMGVSYINFKATAKSLNDRLGMLFDTNTILLKSSLGNQDELKKSIDEALKSAYCNEIAFYEANNKLVYSATYISPNTPAPSWFLNLMNNIGFTKIIQSKYIKQVENGYFEYTANHDFAYTQLYKAFKNSLVVLVVVCFAGALIFYILLKNILKPLKIIQAQAKAILSNEFKLQEELPTTLDIREVVMAMNKVIKQSKELFEKESETFLKYQALIYKDTESGLYNRKYFMIKLEEYLKDEMYSYGVCNLISIDNPNKIKQILGYEKYLSIVDGVSKILLKNKLGDNIVLCRLNDLEFVYISPREQASFIKEITTETLQSIYNLLENFNIKENVNSAIVPYNNSFDASFLLSCLDNTLLIARNESNLCIKIYENSCEILSRNDYKEIILSSIKNHKFGFDAGYVGGEHEHYEMFLRLIGKDGNYQQASYFIPMVSEFGIDAKLDSYVLKYITQLLKENKIPQVNIALNLSKGLINYENLEELENHLKAIKTVSYQKIYFEISDHFNIDMIILEKFVELLRKYDFGFGIDYFMFEESSIKKIEILKPDYVKTRGGYLKELLNGENKILFKKAFDVMTGSKDVKVIATCIENQDLKITLENLGIKAFQGNFISKNIRIV